MGGLYAGSRSTRKSSRAPYKVEEAIRRKTAEGSYDAVNDHRFADDRVITVSEHASKRGWAELA